jgi:hypothetical protein
MKDEKKARLARRGVKLLDDASPDKLKDKLGESAKQAAEDVVLGGIELLGSLTGERHEHRMQEREAARAAFAERQVERALDAIDDQSAESFEKRLVAAARAKADRSASKHATLATLRKSFPEESREFAVLVFACADLLEDLAEETQAKDELARREQLLVRVTSLLAPHAGEALKSFVSHIVALSRSARG